MTEEQKQLIADIVEGRKITGHAAVDHCATQARAISENLKQHMRAAVELRNQLEKLQTLIVGERAQLSVYSKDILHWVQTDNPEFIEPALASVPDEPAA